MTYHCTECEERWTYGASIGRIRYTREHEDAAAKMAAAERRLRERNAA